MANRLSNRSATAADDRTTARWLSGERQSPKWRANEGDGGDAGGDLGLGFEIGGGEEESKVDCLEKAAAAAESEEEMREEERVSAPASTVIAPLFIRE